MNQQQINEKVANDEKVGRELFEQVCNRERWCKINKFSKKKDARWDVSFFNDKQPVIADIKKRRYESRTFQDWFFEVDKAEALIKLAKESNQQDTKIGYINIFDDNIMWVWTLTEEQINKMEPIMMLMQENDWTGELKWKKVYCLTAAQATRKEEIDLTKSIFNNQ